MSLAWSLVVAWGSTAVIWIGSVALEDAAERLSDYYCIPAVVLLVALLAGVLVAGATTVDLGVAISMLSTLVAATVPFFAVVRTDLALTDAEAYGLPGAYGVFVGWLVLESLDATDTIG